eukprot:3114816-Rhodomonas_salina.2
MTLCNRKPRIVASNRDFCVAREWTNLISFRVRFCDDEFAPFDLDPGGRKIHLRVVGDDQRPLDDEPAEQRRGNVQHNLQHSTRELEICQHSRPSDHTTTANLPSSTTGPTRPRRRSERRLATEQSRSW